MEDLEIIQKVVDQHKVLFDQIISVSGALSDKDALLRLERAQAELSVDFRRPLAERRVSLIESLTIVGQGLKNHYAFEEEMLPPLLGKLLTRALIIEHKNLTAEMQELIVMINDLDLKGMSHIDEISQEAAMSEALRKLRNKKLDHQKREEAILLTLQYISEEKAKQ